MTSAELLELASEAERAAEKLRRSLVAMRDGSVPIEGKLTISHVLTLETRAIVASEQLSVVSYVLLGAR